MSTLTGSRADLCRAWTWPAPALVAWGLAWVIWFAGRAGGLTPAWLMVGSLVPPLVIACLVDRLWRQCIVLAGFPLSIVAQGGAGSMPHWVWGLLLVPFLAAYPMRTWRDAPYFPSAPDALFGLRAMLGLPPSPRMLDAGCGAGHGLRALAREWPEAKLQGTEWSWMLAGIARWRCPQSRIRHGDMWKEHWGEFDLVYLFQRPESMDRAWSKAQNEMRPGAWLVSLEFGVLGTQPTKAQHTPGARPVLAWCIGHGSKA